MTYKIEKVGPPPANGSNKFPFDKLKKGESFLETDFGKVNMLKVHAHKYAAARKNKVKFSVRKEGDGYRCYRVK